MYDTDTDMFAPASGLKLVVMSSGIQWSLAGNHSKVIAVLKLASELPMSSEPYTYQRGKEYGEFCRAEMAKVGVTLTVVDRVC